MSTRPEEIPALLSQTEEMARAYYSSRSEAASLLNGEMKRRVAETTETLLALLESGVPVDEPLLIRLANLGRTALEGPVQARLLSFVLDSYGKLQSRKIESERDSVGQRKIRRVETERPEVTQEYLAALRTELKGRIHTSASTAAVHSFGVQTNPTSVHENCVRQYNPRTRPQQKKAQPNNRGYCTQGTTKPKISPKLSRPGVFSHQSKAARIVPETKRRVQVARTPAPAMGTRKGSLRSGARSVVAESPSKESESERDNTWIGVRSSELENDELWSKI